MVRIGIDLGNASDRAALGELRLTMPDSGKQLPFEWTMHNINNGS